MKPTPPTEDPRISVPAGTPADLLDTAALAFLTDLHDRFDVRRLGLLAERRNRQAAFDAGALPDFRTATRSIRESEWRVAPLPAALRDRRVEITGPVDPKMVINALNSGASCYMADFEDSTSPTWRNLLTGQRALRDAIAGTLEFTSDAGKHYALKPEDQRAVLIVRPRGWHLDEKHVRIDGTPMSGALFDAGLFAFHNAHALAAKDRGPYFYIPKLQSMEEAQLWDDVLAHIERSLGLPAGQIRVTVLIETLPAVFEMDEILYALKDRIAGLNCGRWDYIFSYLKTFRRHRDRVLPERAQVTMTQPFLKAYSELLVQTCHRRGAHAMGGMAAQIPIAGDDAANNAAMARVRADKLREVTAGHDGTWVAHPALIPLAKQIFDERMRGPHQHAMTRDDVLVDRDDLIAPSIGTISRAGFDGNVEVCVRYIAAWLDGNGCVPIHHMMEDAATAEIARAQLWQWIHYADDGHAPLHLDDGTAIDDALLDRVLLSLPSKLAGQDIPGAARVPEAIALLEDLTHRDTLEDFLTLPAYARL
ncbi:malate synthase A [Luteimonas fraxinea]|uniref:malate synthase n=1 Tax=Luteimonas fraxinea TaxID=2901869 RepID=A0ABS8UD59_9GAMM|nr:malate synthase A [Luteimonas fraxinea]MCD9097440.1 malate synthase A [Luteimonas fraxinea]MCD9125002.1 malate synthase A [Luteimonas fraxinea]UHH11881.1 malate synthase A [Luteimonas fraxinea]